MHKTEGLNHHLADVSSVLSYFESIFLNILCYFLNQELMMIHSAQHLEDLMELVTLAASPETIDEAQLKCISRYQGVYVNDKTLDCTRMAAAASIDLVEGIVKGKKLPRSIIGRFSVI